MEYAQSLVLLTPSEYKITEPFFTEWTLNESILYAVLDDKSAGQVFVDNKENALFVLVCNPAGYTFLAGDLNENSLFEVATYLKTLPQVFLVSPLEWQHREFFEKMGFNPCKRMQLRKSQDLKQVNFWKESLPSHYCLENISDKNFANCSWHSFITSYYGNSNRFHAHGIGYCLTYQGNVIAESYGLIARGKTEIGVVTDENYRGQNLGTIISAFMLDYCAQHNIEPIWSCNLENPASASVAKKLGFKEDQAYYFLKHYL